ncbi:TolB family protein [Actinoplanes sp. NPDC049681]|uniref:TolB family protein n=1 Tax=Actinoplanes sp. NPDC049681 TaxID=3363905 RepID=UPI0037AA190A
MTGRDPLRESLTDLAGTVAPADLYERSLRRSRRIGRREAAIGTGAAVLALGLLGSGLWQLPHASVQSARGIAAVPLSPAVEAPAASPSAAGTASTAPAPTRPPGRPGRPRPKPATVAKPRSTSLAALPGKAFYDGAGTTGNLVRLTRDGDPETVLSAPFSTLGVSPDGTRIAYVSGGELLVVGTAGGEPQRVFAGTASADQAPAWSPDGARLLIDATDPGLLDVATGRLDPLPSGLEGEHYRWSGDGTTLVYATPSCGLEVAGVDASSGTPVPDQDPADGPAACRPVSVDTTGDLVTVQTEGAATGTADAVLDTRTGELVALPVAGKIIGAVFDAEGNLLVRWVRDGTNRLSLFDRDFALLVQTREPAELKGLDLVAYTR